MADLMDQVDRGMPLIFNDREIELLRRPYQRSLKIRVRPNGAIVVSANRTVSEATLKRFLTEAWPWVLKTLNITESLKQKYPPKVFQDGEEFLYLGQMRRLEFLLGTARDFRFQVVESRLIVWVPLQLRHLDWRKPRPEIGPHLHQFYEKQGREILGSRFIVFSRLMGLEAERLSFRAQKSRWGSCSPRGTITLNWKLVAAPIQVMDYVIIHELAHLVHPNHSTGFWHLVEKYCPDYKAHKKWLRVNQFELDFLSRRSELHGPE